MKRQSNTKTNKHPKRIPWTKRWYNKAITDYNTQRKKSINNHSPLFIVSCLLRFLLFDVFCGLYLGGVPVLSDVVFMLCWYSYGFICWSISWYIYFSERMFHYFFPIPALCKKLTSVTKPALLVHPAEEAMGQLRKRLQWQPAMNLQKT